jgi:hypothetical protein
VTLMSVWWCLVKLEIICVDDKDDHVTTRMTNNPKWWRVECHVMTKVTPPDNTLTNQEQPKYIPNDPDDKWWLPDLSRKLTYVENVWKRFEWCCNRKIMSIKLS